MKKILSIGVIVLFLGLACAPSINADVSRDNELVEVITEICGLGGGKHTVQLTQEEAEEVDRLFESIRERLNATKSREEAVEIFNDAIVELDKYGLIGGLSVEQAQRLVTKHYKNIKSINPSEQSKYVNNASNYILSNFFCLLTGRVNYGINFEGPFSRLCHYIYYFTKNSIILNLYSNFIEPFLDIIMKYIDEYPNILGPISFVLLLPFLPAFFSVFYMIFNPIIVSFSPVHLGSIIGIGGKLFFHSSNSTYSCRGRLNTFGLLGAKNCSGNFYGHIIVDPVQLFFILWSEASYPGVLGFTGFRIEFENDEYPLFLLGSALFVKVGSDVPNNPWVP